MAHRLAGPGPPSASVCGSCAGATRASRIDGARAAAAASQRVWWCPPFGSLRGRQTLGGAGRRRSGRRGADAPATTTTTVVCAAAEGEGFFESNIVQNEMDRLQDDYQNLLKLGRRYGQFDRQGKKLYIQEMKVRSAAFAPTASLQLASKPRLPHSFMHACHSMGLIHS